MKPSIENIKRVIYELKKIDLRFSDRSKISRLIDQLPIDNIIKFKVDKGQILYRLRPNPKNIENISQKSLSYTPNNLDPKFKRASTPETTMFYCWTNFKKIKKDNLYKIIKHIEASNLIRENKKSYSQDVIVSSWIVNKPIIIAGIFERKAMNYGVIDDAYLKVIRKEDGLTKKEKLLVNDYMVTQFKKKRVNREEYFMISALFANKLIRTGFEGVAYNNVRDYRKGIKIALTTNVADTKIRLLDYQECNIKIKDRLILYNSKSNIYENIRKKCTN